MLTKEKIYNTINEVIISYKDSYYDVIEKGEGNLPYIKIPALGVDFWYNDCDESDQWANFSDYIKHQLPEKYKEEDVYQLVDDISTKWLDSQYDYEIYPLELEIWGKVEDRLTEDYTKKQIRAVLGIEYEERYAVDGIIGRKIDVGVPSSNILEYFNNIGFPMYS